MSGPAWEFDTRAVHAASVGGDRHGATSVPIYQTSGFAYESAEELEALFSGRAGGYVYSRIANPTVSAFEAQLTALEGGRATIATASGMAAITTVLLTLTRSGDRVLSGAGLFGGTLMLYRSMLQRSGVAVDFVDAGDEEAVREKLHGASLFFVEAIGNPGLEVPDLKRLGELCAAANVPMVVDATLCTPYLLDARACGAALVVHSTTKFIAGNGASVGGAVVDTGAYDWSAARDRAVADAASRFGKELGFLATARAEVTRNSGNGMSPFTAFLQIQGLQTLGLRMERHCENARRLAEALDGHPAVEEACYPGRPGHPSHETAKRLFGGRFGPLLTLRLGSRERAFALANRLKLAKQLANLGDAKTIVLHPASTIYRDVSEEEKRKAGVTEDMIRVSAGIEDGGDIVADFQQALE